MKLNRIMGLTPSKEMEPIVTGFTALDIKTNGLPIGEITTIAGRPGMGTTAFAISLLRNIGVIQKVPSAYLSLDVPEFEIVKRLKASLTGRWEDDQRRQNGPSLPKAVIEEFESAGFFHHTEQDRNLVFYDNEKYQADNALKLMKEAPVWIEHDLCVTMNEIISRMERLHQENNVRIFFIDSLRGMLFADKYGELALEIMKLRQAASRLNVAVVVIAPLNRSVEYRAGSRRPMLSDLRDFGHLEIYSSLVMLLYRPEYYKIDTFEDDSPAENMADILVEKNRYGEMGNVRMRFVNHASFREVVCEEDYCPAPKVYEASFNNVPF
jgi:replicative DNA helicase